ncbi:hypothetical protein F7888_00850 [Bacillus sp. PS06]|nr:hypothetical protein [Bacillus sp. PS06]
MLVAINEYGQSISLLDHYDVRTLRELRNTQNFFCPICKKEVQLKIGQKKVSHFSHYQLAECTIDHEAETETHLTGKQQLFTWLKQQYEITKLEPYLKSIAQRPDILIEKNDKAIAIEFQCSRLSDSSFQKRTLSYLDSQITPIWMINASHLKQVSTYQFTMSPFIWQFLTKFNHQYPTIIYYSPQKQSFYQLSSIIPFSPTLSFGQLNETKLNDISLDVLLYRKSHTAFQHFQYLWIQQKVQFRLHFSIYPQKNQRRLLLALYQNRMSPSLIPAEAGLPCPTMYWIHTSSCIWQLWIIIDSLLNLKIGEIVGFKTVYRAFCNRVRTKDIIVRTLPLVTSNSHVSFAVMEYLQMLCKVNILEKVSKTDFRKRSNFTIPVNDSQSFEVDRKVINLLTRKTN